jgi:hypothetical protein
MRLQTVSLGIALVAVMVSANAQWLNYPVRGTPMTRDGKPNLTAKTPRTNKGNPDLSGVWCVEPPPPGEIERIFGDLGPNRVEGDDPRTYAKHFLSLLVGFKPGEEPIRPEAAALTLSRRQTMDSPMSHCLPLGVPAIELIVFPSRSSRLRKRLQSFMR